jgi:hypothetical protein
VQAAPRPKRAPLVAKRLSKAKKKKTKPAALSAEEKAELREEERHCLRELRIVLRDIIHKLSHSTEKRFQAFLHPVDVEKHEDYSQYVKVGARPCGIIPALPAHSPCDVRRSRWTFPACSTRWMQGHIAALKTS